MDSEPLDVRLPLMIRRSFLEKLDAWRFANRVPSRAEAVRLLVEASIAAGWSVAPAMERDKIAR